MRLHPWPVNDGALPAREAVLWRAAGGASLLIDTPAVPLRFSDEFGPEVDDVMPIPAADSPLLSYADALTRIRSLEAQLLCCRELGAR